MKENGKMICSISMELRRGMMVLDLRETIRMAKNADKDFMCGLMGNY